MAYRKVAQEVIASMAPSSNNVLATVFNALGAKRILIMVYGGATAGCKVASASLYGSIDGISSVNIGDRLSLISAATPVSPVGLTRGLAQCILWYPGRTGAVAGPDGWAWPSCQLSVNTDATAGTSTGVNVEVWIDDGTLAGQGPAAI